VRARLAALRSDERGYSLVELLTAMSILAAVMTSLTVVLVAATNADARMNQEFQAQTLARTALERFRREGHAACKADPAGATSSITLTYLSSTGGCPASGGVQVSWCTVANGSSRYGLFRSPGPTCSSTTGLQLADYLIVANAFNFQTTPQRRAQIGITLSVNTNPAKVRGTYSLEDDIVLRNTTRSAT
jgi:prepilin-type N-terminal cleavage/methylation domain-containing protein